MNSANALFRHSAVELARQIRDQQLTSRSVVQSHIERIQAVNPRINAVVQTRFDDALAEAEAADQRIAGAAAKEVLPPLLGVPCTIKENFGFPGFPQVSGMVARRNTLAEKHAPTVARLRAAGAIVMGLSNTPELCMWMETHNRVYGRTRNPYDARCIAGGSSGGEGAIIGSGGSPFGLGADVGGSIRMPAFFNGVFGHKPTPGYVTNRGQIPEPQGGMNLNCVTGPLARRADDLWPLLKILSGPDGFDPEFGDHPLDGDPASYEADGIRVINIPDNGNKPVSQDLAQAQARATQWLGEQGCAVETRRPRGLKRSFQIWSALMQATEPEPFAVQLGQGKRISLGKEFLKLTVRQSDHTLPALTLAALEQLSSTSKATLTAAEQLREELLELLGDNGVLLFPPYTRAAPRHNWPMLTPFDFAYCGIFNVLGFPSTQVPLGLNQNGLPLGVQVVAAPGRDALSIAVAQRLESGFGGWQPPPDLA